MNFIVSVDRNWNIGFGGNLLLPIPEDLKRFRNITIGKVIVLGRKTLETFPGRMPLAGRTNIILTRQRDFTCEGAVLCHSYPELHKELMNYKDDDIYIIGGGEIYGRMIPCCRTGYITKINKAFEADTGIINLDADNDWSLVSEEGPYTYGNDICYSYLQYENKNIKPFNGFDE